MATHCSILAQRISWTEEPDGLYSPWGTKESDMTEQLTHTETVQNRIVVSEVKCCLFFGVVGKGKSKGPTELVIVNTPLVKLTLRYFLGP